MVGAILEELAREIHASVGVRMHRLGVCEWEVKLWMASSGQANVAWRVVVTNVTGHTCTVHVCLYIAYILLKKTFPTTQLHFQINKSLVGLLKHYQSWPLPVSMIQIIG